MREALSRASIEGTGRLDGWTGVQATEAEREQKRYETRDEPREIRRVNLGCEREIN